MGKPMLRSKPRKTVDDYMALPVEGHGVELIRGEFAVSPSPQARHQIVVGNLLVALHAYLERRPIGKAIVCPLDVIFGPDTVVQPDLILIRTERLPILTDRVRGTPDLLIEVLSPGTVDRDRFVKRELYERNGVAEYWIVDPDARTVEVFSLKDAAAYGPAALFEAGETIEGTTVLPGLELRLDSLWD